MAQAALKLSVPMCPVSALTEFHPLQLSGVCSPGQTLALDSEHLYKGTARPRVLVRPSTT